MLARYFLRDIHPNRRVGVLSRWAYRKRGVCQSSHRRNQREELCELDARVSLRRRGGRRGAEYGNDQRALILNPPKMPRRCLPCGDSNQIVPPNLFSWSKVKSLYGRSKP